MWRKIQLNLLSYLYRNRTVRHAKRWAFFYQKCTLALVLTSFIFQWNYKTDRLIKANEELTQPMTFMIDGPDPFKMTAEQWKTVEDHYLRFHYK